MGRSPSHQTSRVRFVSGILLTAVLSSAVTATMFLAMQPKDQQPNPLADWRAAAEEEVRLLTPSLEKFAADYTSQRNTTEEDATPRVALTYSTRPAEAHDMVPMVNDAQRTVAQMPPQLWRLSVESSHETWQSPEIFDVQRSSSVTDPGYIAVVEFQVKTVRHTHQAEGLLTPTPPGEYAVVSPDRYAELQAAGNYGEEVLTAKPVTGGELYFHFNSWTPAEPPPTDLPEDAKEACHGAIIDCLEAQPTITTMPRQVRFMFSLRDKKWTQE